MSEGGIQPKGCTRIRIDITADDDLHLWSKRFDVTPAEIKRVVLKVGPFATDVERELYKTG